MYKIVIRQCDLKEDPILGIKLIIEHIVEKITGEKCTIDIKKVLRGRHEEVIKKNGESDILEFMDDDIIFEISNMKTIIKTDDDEEEFSFES